MSISLESQLKQYFGYDHFRTGQREIIEAVMNKQNVLAVLPTGSGKSICYQLPSLLLNGTVIVVSPLLSLMTDQVKQLKSIGFKKVAAINSMITNQEKHQILKELAYYKLLYVSPEMLQNTYFMNILKTIKTSLLVVDEAHCISQWGYEFRPDYLRLSEVHSIINNPPILALTATATEEVQKDIMKTLKINDCKRMIYPMDKPNISFVVEHILDIETKREHIISLLERYSVPCMIYFSSRNESEKMTLLLQQKLPNLRIAYYHGGLETNDRLLIQQQFMENQLDVICCTNAFGMGINKLDIRLIIHFHMPSQIESFIQEVGRAGRDGQESVSVLYFHETDPFIPKRLFITELPQLGIVKQCLQLMQKSPDIPLLEVEIYFMQLTDNNETQWRFLTFQLEKLHVLSKENGVDRNFDLNQVLEQLGAIIQQRMEYKNRKMAEMVDWIYSNACRREKLYHYFQEGIKSPMGMCCDNCDFNWEKWKPVNLKQGILHTNWDDKLAYILLQDKLKV